MEIIVVPGDWGASLREDVVAVVRNVTEHLNSHFATVPTGTIHVKSRLDSNPQMAYRKTRSDPYSMFVNASDCLWARLAYQSAHEYCHILSGYESLQTPGNQWFHESICEMASFFCLLEMAESWKTSAPYPNWTDYAPHLRTYAVGQMNIPCCGFRPEMTLMAWLEANVKLLRNDPYLRDLNRIVAVHLLPLFQSNPEMWECVAHMPDTGESFHEFLSMWEEKVPENCRSQVQLVAKLFC